MRSGLLRQAMKVEPTETQLGSSLDRLDDAGIDGVHHRTLREHARSLKRQSGMLV
jgi:hypothetical protein